MPNMTTPLENILQRLRQMPMVVALPIVVAGVLCADATGMPLWVASILFLISFLTALKWRRFTLLALAIFLAGALSLSLRREGEHIPSHRTYMELRLKHITHEDDSLRQFASTLLAYDELGVLRRSHSSIRVTTPLAAKCCEGGHIVIEGSVRSHNPSTDYGSYMLRKGVVGSVKVQQQDIISLREGFMLGAWLQQKAQLRIGKLSLSESTQSIATAISIGRQSRITPSQRHNYTLSGGSHLLAVSGLHVGFVFVIINLLLLPLSRFRGGTVLRSLLACTLIWCYALMAHSSPSVVRAATMLTIFQLSLMLGSGNMRLNSLCFTVFVMILWDGRTIYDAGLLLSFIAVAAIVEWAVPLLRLIFRGNEQTLPQHLKRQHPILGPLKNVARYAMQWIISVSVVSLVANIATLPLASHLFGKFSLWGIVVGAPMVALCSIATMTLLMWILLPIPPLAGVASWVVETTVGAMNRMAEWCATEDAINFNMQIDEVSCWLIYTAYLLITVALWSINKKGRLNSTPFSLSKI